MSQNWILKISITIFTFDLKDMVQGHNWTNSLPGISVYVKKAQDRMLRKENI